MGVNWGVLGGLHALLWGYIGGNGGSPETGGSLGTKARFPIKFLDRAQNF